MSLYRGARKAMERYIAQVKKATDPKVDNHMKEYIMLWDFSKPEVIEQWDCICDTDMDGFSHASFEPNSQGTGAIFKGKLDTKLPLNKTARRSGYAAIRSKPKQPDWFEKPLTDLSEYDGFELCVRGDGRRFIANVDCPNFVTKEDLWQYFMMTRGGPEWEKITLLFGKFFVTSAGYMQDHKFPFNRRNFNTFGLLLADRVVGEFELEIKYIRVVRRLLEIPELED